ncbi:CBS domain-containing protein [Salinicoccus halitifaciens]|uniref:CBS domain-containing protein n=1 Tax=Salinicoccus halitifaciens TaxID=1073415 RepID=A0ABV2EB95_9STAP|nr:CBS domain-containing protein [Salinicoccus halitifaciens]MCD2137572.1 CBS domain-containing protein [Salinicoccus halitifaciens]
MEVRDIMRTEVETCGPEMTIETVASMMKEFDLGSIPVLGDGELKGMITDRDIVIRGIASHFPMDTPIDLIMASDAPLMGTPIMSVEDAADIMVKNRLRCLPIVEEGRVVGMLVLSDVTVDEDQETF